ncbi:MAG: ABC transporter substrate-binding protein [Eubacteriales bacterium]|jgi:putative ABC transport system substrate-binding protein|nr:ABC transporter substrate-binding protein [Eubacteriales bacterium]MDD3289968.1 ABC transporter substrate-binding protein [Eubacteriales bacterium]MDD3863534.1 ABC transporter substrate-binding protein [Eubacteriales bacterium]MDD4444450.1 ABC transporter substrate-binding protein [Eubacteriales bacterium]
MKKAMKKCLILMLTLAMIVSASACSGGPQEEDLPKIGILQFAPHASLDNCYNGIVQGLAEAGFKDGETCTIEFVNGQGESETNALAAANFVNNGMDIIIAIATPSAMPAYAAAKDAGIPVIFSAVSDPLGAGLVKSLEEPNTGATGTSDGLNYEGQLQMIRAFQPEAETIGILYTTSEANSLAQLENYQALAGSFGFEIVSVGVTDASEVASGAASLVASGVDCINNLTDNNVVNNFSMVTAAADPAGIPCYGSEEEQVAKYGCVASETLDYVALGHTTGTMAAEVLSGSEILTMAVQVVTDSEPVYSSVNMGKFELVLPEAYQSARERNE